MPFVSTPELLVLHAARIQGIATTGSIVRRFWLDRDTVDELLLDHQACGYVQRVGFADVTGWSLTDAGRTEGRRLLAKELDDADVWDEVAKAHASFVGLNATFLQLVTAWQIRPTGWDSMAKNDHTDWRWDEDVRKGLASCSERLHPVGEQLAHALARFDGYLERFTTALERVDRGERKWVDEPRIDSCHTVWFELHEDLLATLGLDRGHGV